MRFVNVSKSVCLVLIIGLCSCVKETPTSNTNNLPKDPVYKEYWLGEAKDYMYFKHGTWWVYKNMQNGKTDSVYVTLSKLDTTMIRGTETYSSHRIYTSETCRVVTKSMKYNKFYDWNSSSKNPDATSVSGQGFSFYRNKSAPGGFVQPCFHTPFIDNLRNDVPLINNDTTLIIGTTTYQNVKIFRPIQDDTYPDILNENSALIINYSQIYYAKNIGIIKYEIPELGASIELVNSNIVQ